LINNLVRDNKPQIISALNQAKSEVDIEGMGDREIQ